MMWPAEYGGRGAPPGLQAVLYEELALAEAPQHLGVIGLNMVGPTIIASGTDQQKSTYLSRILSAEDIWCQGYSEPGAGSDLAAIRTRGTLDDSNVVLSGQKVWSSYAHVARYCMLLARTEAGSTGKDGLTCVIVDMQAAGVEVRPLRELTGDAVFNEVYLDDVVVPSTNLLGAAGEGWKVAMTTLLHERGTMAIALVSALDALFRRMMRDFDNSSALGSPIIRDYVAQAWVDLQALKLLNRRTLSDLSQTGVPGPEGSALKLSWSTQNQRLTKLALDLAGSDAQTTDAFWRYQQLRSRANTIEAGTSEILRSLIAERVLKLPRSR